MDLIKVSNDFCLSSASLTLQLRYFGLFSIDTLIQYLFWLSALSYSSRINSNFRHRSSKTYFIGRRETYNGHNICSADRAHVVIIGVNTLKHPVFQRVCNIYLLECCLSFLSHSSTVLKNNSVTLSYVT